MTTNDHPASCRRPLALPGVLLALIALAMQFAAASIVLPATPTIGAERLLAAPICHSETGGGAGHHGGQAPHHAPDCAVCPLCQAIAHAGMLLAAPPLAFAVPVLAIARGFGLQPARAPPSVTSSATSARGPPAPI